jgi:DNA-binding MarR family transcriptional regulator
MFKWLRRAALTLAPLGLLVKMVIDKRRLRVSADSSRLLSYLATHASGPVPEIASRLKLGLEDTLQLLAELEQRGLVQLSGDQGIGHVRIAAITKAGRERVV